MMVSDGVAIGTGATLCSVNCRGARELSPAEFVAPYDQTSLISEHVFDFENWGYIALILGVIHVEK